MLSEAFQKPAQADEGAHPQLLHTVERPAHALGHLRKSQGFQVTQDNHFPVVGREFPQGVGQQDRLLAAGNLLTGGRPRRHQTAVLNLPWGQAAGAVEKADPLRRAVQVAGQGCPTGLGSGPLGQPEMAIQGFAQPRMEGDLPSGGQAALKRLQRVFPLSPFDMRLPFVETRVGLLAS